MPDKASKKKPEIPQPRPDIILPDDKDAADFADQTVLRSPSPRNEACRQSQCPDQKEL